MRRLFAVLLGALLLAGLGCSSDKDRGINSQKDMPRTATSRE